MEKKTEIGHVHCAFTYFFPYKQLNDKQKN